MRKRLNISKKRMLMITIIIQMLIIGLFLLLNLLSPKTHLICTADEFTAEAGHFTDGKYTITEKDGYVGPFTSGPQISIPRGSYTIDVEYSTNAIESNFYYIISEYGHEDGFRYDENIFLAAGDQHPASDIYVYKSPVTFNVQTYYNYGNFSVGDIEIKENNKLTFMTAAIVLVFFSAADALVFMWMFGKFKSLNKNQFAAAAVLLLLMLVLCLPLFENSLRIGHDFQFHMLRIEGLKDGILSGQFPVRIHPLENNGYGYATSLFYPELFLIFPALVRIIGFPLDFCYKLFLAAINVCAVLISYYSFLEIFKKRYTALIGAMVYSLSLYRIVNMYLRSAVGELLAMTFFPLIAAALFDILSRPVTSAEFKRGWVFGVAGFCGVIQSHLICTAFAGIFTVLACLCFAKRTFEKQRFKALFKTAFFSVALNLWFIIPLLDMMRGKYNVTVNSFDTYAHSVVPRQLFSIFVSGAGISNELGSEAGEMPLGIGLALIIGIAVFLVVLIAKAMRDKSLCRLGIFSACAGAASLFLTTCLFPWNTFQNLGGFFNSFACALQFPWRFLSTATLFLTLVTCCAASALNAEILKKIFFAIGSAASVFTLVIFFSGYSASFTACGTAAISTCSLGNREYLPIGTNVDMMVQGKPESQFIKVNSYTKSGTEIKMELENPSSIERAVSVPLLYYPGYTAKCADGSLRLGHNAENKVTVLVPAEYSGEVSIGYTGKPIWKIADALTIILAAIFCVFLKREFGSSFRKKQKQTENTSGKKHIYRESEKV